MAVPRKGWRTITVDEKLYYWRATGTDWDLSVAVVTSEAFERGETAQQLRFHLNYDHRREPMIGGGVALHQRAAVTPGVIRRAIHVATAMTPSFTGVHGQPDIILEGTLLDLLQAEARAAR